MQDSGMEWSRQIPIEVQGDVASGSQAAVQILVLSFLFLCRIEGSGLGGSHLCSSALLALHVSF